MLENNQNKLLSRYFGGYIIRMENIHKMLTLLPQITVNASKVLFHRIAKFSKVKNFAYFRSFFFRRQNSRTGNEFIVPNE